MRYRDEYRVTLADRVVLGCALLVVLACFALLAYDRLVVQPGLEVWP